MENNKSKLATWLKEPIVTKKTDPFLNVFLAFVAALIGNAFYQNSDMGYGEYVLWLILIATLTVLFIKLIVTAWRKSRQQDKHT